MVAQCASQDLKTSDSKKDFMRWK